MVVMSKFLFLKVMNLSNLMKRCQYILSDWMGGKIILIHTYIPFTYPVFLHSCVLFLFIISLSLNLQLATLFYSTHTPDKFPSSFFAFNTKLPIVTMLTSKDFRDDL